MKPKGMQVHKAAGTECPLSCASQELQFAPVISWDISVCTTAVKTITVEQCISKVGICHTVACKNTQRLAKKSKFCKFYSFQIYLRQLYEELYVIQPETPIYIRSAYHLLRILTVLYRRSSRTDPNKKNSKVKHLTIYV